MSQVGFEPTTNRLRGDCSTAELLTLYCFLCGKIITSIIKESYILIFIDLERTIHTSKEKIDPNEIKKEIIEKIVILNNEIQDSNNLGNLKEELGSFLKLLEGYYALLESPQSPLWQGITDPVLKAKTLQILGLIDHDSKKPYIGLSNSFHFILIGGQVNKDDLIKYLEEIKFFLIIFEKMSKGEGLAIELLLGSLGFKKDNDNYINQETRLEYVFVDSLQNQSNEYEFKDYQVFFAVSTLVLNAIIAKAKKIKIEIQKIQKEQKTVTEVKIYDDVEINERYSEYLKKLKEEFKKGAEGDRKIGSSGGGKLVAKLAGIRANEILVRNPDESSFINSARYPEGEYKKSLSFLLY